MEQRLAGKRILISQAGEYMGPAFAAMFRQHGAQMLEDAMLAVFLASEESSLLAGQAIPFSGGWAQ